MNRSAGEASHRVFWGVYSCEKNYLSNSEGRRKAQSNLRQRLPHVSGEMKDDEKRKQKQKANMMKKKNRTKQLKQK